MVLQSAYTSIKKVVYENFSFFSALVSEQFDNLELCSKIKSPVLLIHGKKDTLISHSHSVKLKEAMTNCVSELYLSDDMTHNSYDFCNDLVKPLLKFCSTKIIVDPLRQDDRYFELDEKFHKNQDFERLMRRDRMKE